MTFKLQVNVPGSVTYAELTDIRSTFRAKVEAAPKNISGVSVTNNRAEFIRVKPMAITNGSVTVSETTSQRVVFSGSIENAAAMAAEWELTKAYVDEAIQKAALRGFVPSDMAFTRV